jgi:hypothetical protein
MANPLPNYLPSLAPLPHFFVNGGTRRCCIPSHSDLEIVRRHFPGIENPWNPNWLAVAAKLVSKGHRRDDLDKLSPPELLVLLDQPDSDQSTPARRMVPPTDRTETHRRTAEPAAPQLEGESKPPHALGCPIVLGGADDDPIVCGRAKERLTPAQYRVVKVLVDDFPERRSGDSLALKSEVGDPIGVIDRLSRDEEWAALLSKPGKAHGGYGINAKPQKPRKTQKNPEKPRKAPTKA